MSTHFTPTRLTDRCVIRASGADVVTLLQGLLTCNVQTLLSGQMIYGFLLTPQGRFLHELFVFKHDDVLYLDTHNDTADTLLKRLKMFTLRSDASFSILPDWQVAVTPEPAPTPAFQDPRHPALGARLYGVHLPITSDNAASYHAHRIALGIPSAEDFVVEKTLLLNYDIDQLGGIDFKKGCYVGQEVTARMHYRNIDKKGLYRVTASAALPAPGTAIFAGDKEAGTLLSTSHGTGIAVINHEYTSQALMADGLPISAVRPSWAKPPLPEAP